MPGDTVISWRVTYAWHWPNDVTHLGSVGHALAVPLVPTLVVVGMSRMVSWALAGDFEGVLTYGIGMPVMHSNPQVMVRAVEVEKVTGHGQHLYIVAIDVDATSMMRG